MILIAVHETVLAQIDNPTPEAPPNSDKILQMVRYLTWLVMLSGVCGITYAGGRFAWEKWNNSTYDSPKMLAGAMLGGVIASSAGTIMNTLVG
ncbi:hypothetical protein ACWEO2_01895 [Nocardia sp. NPDC004278]|uniref:hypothetical protein n=1 Tax=Nocardia sp. NPDC005998 TaxID=3156894 RepID=UPI0033A43E48